MLIFKFGGASVRDATGVRNLGSIIKPFAHEKLVVVVSAMGKSTNLLESLVNVRMSNNDTKALFDEFKEYHDTICLELFGSTPESIVQWYVELDQALENLSNDFGRLHDSVVSYGELISTTIIYTYLKGLYEIEWLDARKVIRTNSIYTEANVDWKLTDYYIKSDVAPIIDKKIVITQGYIGADFTGHTTTLGREGSDYTGAVFAYCLNANSMTVWKDVPGLLNADPKIFPGAEVFPELSFQEVTELTYYGAKVIHPKTIRPLAQKCIPLYVKSFVDPLATGTKVYETGKKADMACFVFKQNQLLVTLRVQDTSLMDEKKMTKIFESLHQANVKVNLMHTSALTYSFCMDEDHRKLDKLRAYLNRDFQILYNENLALATIKNYQDDSLDLLPKMKEVIMEQRTRHTYQIVYTSK